MFLLVGEVASHCNIHIYIHTCIYVIFLVDQLVLSSQKLTCALPVLGSQVCAPTPRFHGSFGLLATEAGHPLPHSLSLPVKRRAMSSQTGGDLQIQSFPFAFS